jgi:glycosyltransferase involved in cell wall biosynthesis
MRLLYDHQIFALQRFGGISRIFVELMKGLAAVPGLQLSWHRGWHVDGYDTTSFDADLEHYSGVTSPPTWAQNSDRNTTNRALFAKFAERAGEFDIFHPSYYDSAVAAIPQRRRMVLTVPDLIPEKYFQDLVRFRDLLNDRRTLILQADCLLVISESTRRDLLEYYPVDPARIRLTYLASGLGEVEETPLPSEFRERPYFLYVGTRSKYKNFEVLLRAFADCPELRAGFSVVCFGGTGGFLDPEVRFMDAHGLRDRFLFVQGDDRMLKGFYRHAEALVYTSRYEGFGLPPLEAMESGCPVVCCPTSSLPEVVGDAAAFFDPDEPADLAAVLLRVTSDSELRTRMVEAGRARAGLFSWQQTVADTLAVYQDVAG